MKETVDRRAAVPESIRAMISPHCTVEELPLSELSRKRYSNEETSAMSVALLKNEFGRSTRLEETSVAGQSQSRAA